MVIPQHWVCGVPLIPSTLYQIPGYFPLFLHLPGCRAYTVASVASVGRMPTFQHSSVKFSKELRYFRALLPEVPLTLYYVNKLNMKLQVSCTLLELKSCVLKCVRSPTFIAANDGWNGG